MVKDSPTRGFSKVSSVTTSPSFTAMIFHLLIILRDISGIKFSVMSRQRLPKHPFYPPASPRAFPRMANSLSL